METLLTDCAHTLSTKLSTVIVENKILDIHEWACPGIGKKQRNENVWEQRRLDVCLKHLEATFTACCLSLTAFDCVAVVLTDLRR
jgi:hypothetical protein